MKKHGGKVEVASGYGGNTRVPYVELRLPERPPMQLEIDEARLVGQMIIEACEAAEQDAFMVEFGMQELNLSMQEAGGLLHQYRQWRERRRQKGKAKSA